MYVSLVVPQPTIEVGAVQSGPYLAGMLAELRCSVTLDDTVDTQVSVDVAWRRNGGELSETVRVRSLPARMVGGSRYDALLQFSTLSSSVDSGSYMCISTVFPMESRDYITNTTQTTSFSFSVAGVCNY